jgi:hypothetical protein
MIVLKDVVLFQGMENTIAALAKIQNSEMVAALAVRATREKRSAAAMLKTTA